jgi:Tfp pilus assembly protein PilV
MPKLRAATAREKATMFFGASLPEVLIVAVPLAVGTLILVSLRESEPQRKWFYCMLVL